VFVCERGKLCLQTAQIIKCRTLFQIISSFRNEVPDGAHGQLEFLKQAFDHWFVRPISQLTPQFIYLIVYLRDVVPNHLYEGFPRAAGGRELLFDIRQLCVIDVHRWNRARGRSVAAVRFLEFITPSHGVRLLLITV
jgi:hypothetical protein